MSWLRRTHSFFQILLIITLAGAVVLGGRAPISTVAAQETDIERANAAFDIELVTDISVSRLGLAAVEHTFTITNTKPTQYAKQYGIQISSGNIDQLAVQVNGEPIEPNVVTNERETTIGITLPEKVVGEGKQNQIVIAYQNPDATVVTGNTLSVYIPKLAEAELFSAHRVTLRTPESFGPIQISNPQPTTSHPVDGSIVTRFENVGNQSLTAYFGQEQNYQLTINHTLANTSSATSLFQLALPPDTPFQRVAYQELTPPPQKLDTDLDGNWIATYQVEPNQSLPITLIATVKRTLQPDGNVPIFPAIKQHTVSQPVWETRNRGVTKFANESATITELYHQVVNTIHFNFERPPFANRSGAAATLDHPQDAGAEEFVDVFVAAARNQGTPARQVIGYGYSENESLRPLQYHRQLHTWAEYFAGNLWHQVDPTWEHTTGGINYFDRPDYHHVALAFRGVSSDQPIPLGDSDGLDSQNAIEVVFADTFPEIASDFSVDVEKVSQFGTPITGLYRLKITNQSGIAHYNLPVTITVQEHRLDQELDHIPAILPYETIEVPITLTTNSPLTVDKSQLQLQLDDQVYQINLQAGPSFIGFFQIDPRIATGLAIVLVLGTLGTGSLLVFKRPR